MTTFSDILEGVGEFVVGGGESFSLFGSENSGLSMITGLFDGFGSGEKGGGFFSNPTVAAASITAGASLFGGLFGSDFNDDRLALLERELEHQIASDQGRLELGREELVSRERIAEIAAGASKYAADVQGGIAKRRDALGLAVNRSDVIGNAADRKIAAVRDRPALIALGRQFQSNAARNVGQAGLEGFSRTAQLAQSGLS